MDEVEIYEEYNPQGVCIRRRANGIDLPPDNEPSIVILKVFEKYTYFAIKRYIPRFVFEKVFGHLLPANDTYPSGTTSRQ